LLGAEAEVLSVAELLGGDGVLRLGGGSARNRVEGRAVAACFGLDHAWLLSVRSGFSHTNSDNADLLAGLGTRQRVPATKEEWENPLVCCGIALAGANCARQINERGGGKGLLTGLEASLLNLQGTQLVILSAKITSAASTHRKNCASKRSQ
jgi:hypothetical protein